MEFIKTFGKNLLNLVRTRKAVAALIVIVATAGGLALAPETADKLAAIACDVIRCVDVTPTVTE